MAIKDLFKFSFHGLQVWAERTIRLAILSFNLLLIITILRRFILISTEVICVSLSRSVENLTCVATHTLTVTEY